MNELQSTSATSRQSQAVSEEIAVAFQDVGLCIQDKVLVENLNFAVKRGENHNFKTHQSSA
jgi:ABC-type molybdenum transport system ATPase subunit/photorepair protein PhrA